MENKICKKCGYLSFSKRKGRKVICKCIQDKLDKEREKVKEE